MRHLVCCVWIMMLSGCYSFSQLGRARVLNARQTQVFVAPEALLIATDSGASVRPTGEVGVRYGVTRDVEFGARINVLGATLTTRIQLLRSQNSHQGVDVLLAPGLAYTVEDKLALELPLVIGFNLGEHQLVVAPRLVYQTRTVAARTSGLISFLYTGLSLGFVGQITRDFALMPEISALVLLHADPGYATNVSNALGLQAGVGLLFDL